MSKQHRTIQARVNRARKGSLQKAASNAQRGKYVDAIAEATGKLSEATQYRTMSIVRALGEPRAVVWVVTRKSPWWKFWERSQGHWELPGIPLDLFERYAKETAQAPSATEGGPHRSQMAQAADGEIGEGAA